MKFTTANYNNPAIHIALTSGHTAIVPATRDVPEGVELEVIFRKEAIARGAVPVGISVEEKPQEPACERVKVIVYAIRQMLNGNEENAFTNDGKPDLRKLNAIVGFTVERSERDSIWAEFEAA